MKVGPPPRGRAPWRSEAHESYALPQDLTRLRQVADSRAEQGPEAGLLLRCSCSALRLYLQAKAWCSSPARLRISAEAVTT